MKQWSLDAACSWLNAVPAVGVINLPHAKKEWAVERSVITEGRNVG